MCGGEALRIEYFRSCYFQRKWKWMESGKLAFTEAPRHRWIDTIDSDGLKMLSTSRGSVFDIAMVEN